MQTQMHFPPPSRERARVRAISGGTTLTSNPLPPKQGERLGSRETKLQDRIFALGQGRITHETVVRESGERLLDFNPARNRRRGFGAVRRQNRFCPFRIVCAALRCARARSF